MHSCVDGHLSFLLCLEYGNSIAMNAWVCVSLQTVFFSGYMPRSVIAGSYGSSILAF